MPDNMRQETSIESASAGILQLGIYDLLKLKP